MVGCLASAGTLWVVGQIWGGDLRYLALWPWWLRALLPVTSSLLPLAALGLTYAAAREALFLLRRSRERIVLDVDGITFVGGPRTVALQWDEVSICRDHPFAVRLFTSDEQYWVIPATRELRTVVGEMERRVRDRNAHKC